MSFVRHLETTAVTGVDHLGCVHLDNGNTRRVPPELHQAIRPGQRVEVETIRGDQVVGWRELESEWLWRLSDDDIAKLDERNRAFRDRIDQVGQWRLETCREEWVAREAALPGWLRARLATFHERGGEHFASLAWDYELDICELAELLARPGATTPAEDARIAEHEASGNQYEFARFLVERHREGLSLAGTFSALDFMGGSFYEPDMPDRSDM